jgi:hypothetical protein
MKKLGKYSLGIGDRFGYQGSAQLKAIIDAGYKGIEITPVWNKSNREHQIIGSEPEDVRKEADEVIKSAGFNLPYFVDADHINLDTVDRFIESSDFFTIDVASCIGTGAGKDEIETFVSGAHKYSGLLKIPGLKNALDVSIDQIDLIAEQYLFAAIKAGEIYKRIEKSKGKGNFVTEVSMDEVSQPQTPAELFFILKMLSEENIPVRTIAPRFSGRFNKGVDYVGNSGDFAREFEADIMVIDFAIKEFGLPQDLKMSIHSGSDKFAIYPYVGSIIRNHNKGIHLKTAGTTWLEEVIGLAESGDDGLEFVKNIYYASVEEIDVLCAPYADVTNINTSLLPSKKEVSGWDGKRFAAALRHIPGNRNYNSNMRQLIHVAYKLAAQEKERYLNLLEENKEIIGQCVYENLYKRHICKLFDIT